MFFSKAGSSMMEFYVPPLFLNLFHNHRSFQNRLKQPPFREAESLSVYHRKIHITYLSQQFDLYVGMYHPLLQKAENDLILTIFC